MYVLTWLLCLVGAVFALPQAENYNRYVGYKVLEVTPSSREQVSVLRKWMLEDTELDFWQEPSKSLSPVHIMASPMQLYRLTTNLRKHGMAWNIYKDHIERDVEQFIAKENQRRAKSNKVFDIDDFNTYDDIITWLQEQLTTCETSGFTCEYYTLDITSVEGRDIPAFTISSDGSQKPVFLLDATIHAREWLTTATILKILDHIVNGNGNELLDNLNFVFIPVVNPDGYDYTWTNERLWRKNRQDLGECVGVDLNRNFDYNWAEEGVSTNPCSDLYCGPSGLSEPETQAIDLELAKYATDVNNGGAFVSFHSYGYMWMHPWGNTVDHAGEVCERADDHDAMFAVAEATALAIMATHDTEWTYGNGCEVIYETTGSTDDYAKGVYGYNYPFVPELRGFGFIISADQIQPSFEEVWAGLVAKYGAINARK